MLQAATSARVKLGDAGHERLLARLSGDFVLRAVRSVARLYDGDMVLALVAAEIVAANTAHLSGQSSEVYGSIDRPPPDDARRPVSGLAIANALGIPRETARRHIKKLQGLGYCRKVQGGYVMTTEALASDLNNEVIRENVANLRRLLDRLQDLGRLS